MVALNSCPACRWGDHENHVTSFAPAAPGVFGGQMCPCDGDCTENVKDFCFVHRSWHECSDKYRTNPEPRRFT